MSNRTSALKHRIKWLEEENERITKERDEWKKHADDFEDMYKDEHLEKNSLIRERNALLDELRWFIREYPESSSSARSILDQYKT